MSVAAYFDVDGTLTATNLIQPTIHYLSNQASVSKSFRRLGKAILDGPRMLLGEKQDRRICNEILFSHYRGMSADRLKLLSEEVFEDIVRPALYPGAPDLIRQCKSAGFRVVLVTGSLYGSTEYLARHLGADDIITNRLEMKDGKATGKLQKPVVAGPEKANLMVADAKLHGHNLSDCHAYSDSYSDVPMLSVVGHAFCVNPDRKLSRLARAYRWPIIDINRLQTPRKSSN